MSAWVASLVLLSALMHAGWNLLVKKGDDAQLDTAKFAVGCSLIAAVCLPFVPAPDPQCYPWLMATMFVHVAYFLTLAEAYKHADLSLAYPLMRGIAPILVAGISFATGELLSSIQTMGILIIGFGIMLPSWMGRPWQMRHQKGLFFSLLNAGIIATYTVLDGNGVRLSGNAASYTLWLFLFNSWGILSVLIWRRGYAVVTIQLFNGWQRSFLGAFLSMASYGIVLWAMTQASIPSVAALREISVVFAALMGAWFLKEPFGRWRIAGATLVGLGAASIRWS
jgi:drug/metabolite transporter (DMT)-like permease